MKYVIGSLAVLVMAFLTFGIVSSQEPGGQVQNKAGSESQFTWSPVTTNVDGTPCDDLEKYQLGVFEPTVVPTTPGVQPLWMYDTTPENIIVALKDIMVVGQKSKGQYRFSVRAVDTYGNASAWSEYIDGDIKLVPPSAPGGCRFIK